MTYVRVQEIIVQIFSLQAELHKIAPEYKWGGLGNLLGAYGEYMSIIQYNLTPAPPGTKDYDALTPNGKTVQIKTNRWASHIGFRGESDLLLVVHVTDDANLELIYYGDAETVYKEARYSERDNKHMITISKLKDLMQT